MKTYNIHELVRHMVQKLPTDSIALLHIEIPYISELCNNGLFFILYFFLLYRNIHEFVRPITKLPLNGFNFLLVYRNTIN